MGRKKKKKKKEEHLETENVANRSLGRRKATSIHNTNKITTTTTTTPTKNQHHSRVKSLVLPFLGRLRVANRLRVDFANVEDGPLFCLSLPREERKKERRVQNEIKIKKKKKKKKKVPALIPLL